MDKIRELNASVDDLIDQARTIRTELRRQTRTIWLVFIAACVVIGLSIAALALVGVDQSNQINENNRKFCPVLSAFVPQPGEPPPSTPRGRIVAENFEQLLKDFHCE